MTRTAAVVGQLAAAAVGAALIGSAPPAVARQPDPPEPPTATIVRTVEIPVPVPIHDRATEAARMGVAATLGAALAAGATAARLRRRRLPPGTGLIDITDAVQASRPAGVGVRHSRERHRSGRAVDG
jgi:hypothetical protein